MVVTEHSAYIGWLCIWIPLAIHFRRKLDVCPYHHQVRRLL